MMSLSIEASDLPLTDLLRTECPPGGRGPLPGGCNTSWLVSEPASFGKSGPGSFAFPSAICYFFARALYTGGATAGVPIGVITAAVGGSQIETWMSVAARADTTCGGANIAPACPPTAAVDRNLSLPGPAVGGGGGDDGDGGTAGPTPGEHFNAMIAPLAPMTLRGILWDQGTSDAADSCQVWGCKLGSLARDWRLNVFRQPGLLFTADQLRAGAIAGGVGVPGYSNAIPHSTYATRVDLATCLSNATFYGHSRRKREVGRRLALAAQVIEYGQPASPASFGPEITSVVARPVSAASGKAGDQLLNVSVTLSHATSLHFSDGPECAGCCHGRTGPQIQGVPATGDSWSVGFSDGSVATVCKDAALGCDGAANIRPGGSVDWLAPAHGAAVVRWVVYGGGVPWLDGNFSLPQQRRREAGDDEPPGVTEPLGCVMRFGLGACGIYNGVGGYDDHAGIAMAAQLFRVPTDAPTSTFTSPANKAKEENEKGLV